MRCRQLAYKSQDQPTTCSSIRKHNLWSSWDDIFEWP